MTTLYQDISDKLKRLNVLEKLIVVNVAVFLFGFVFGIVFGLPKDTGLDWLELPSDFYRFIRKPWAVITYAFTHYDFIHLLFNMIWLYFIGRMFINLFSSKIALNVYFLGAICGGVLFMLAYDFLPKSSSISTLVGASASARALLIFLCAYMPNLEVRFFTFKLKLWYIGVAIVVIDLLGLMGENGGGHLAHLGGVLLGYVYAKQYTKGNDIGKGFERLMDGLFGWFTPRKSPLKTVHKNKNKMGGYAKSDFNAFNNQKKVDVILDKISKSGYESLTSDEKDFLFRAGK